MEGGEIDKRPARVAGMFDAIAARYDLLNHLLSLGLDRRWRRRAVASLHCSETGTLLDICTGTGDVALSALSGRARPARVVGVDFAGRMLAHAARKLDERRLRGRVELVRGDATRLPVACESVDAATIAFGIRNVSDPPAALSEILRVLRPGGRLAILEFGVPRAPVLRHLYLWYFRRVLPLVGRSLSGHQSAYRYLPASVGAFLPPERLAALLGRVGFADVEVALLSGGIVYLYTGRRPATPGAPRGGAIIR